MGEYFVWANPARKEYLDADGFGECGFMLSIASYQGSLTTRAAHLLMADRWKGDRSSSQAIILPVKETSLQK